jgi:hypothetical protein
VGKHILKGADADAMTYIVYRSKGNPPDEITGPGLTASLQDGALIIWKNGVAVFIYGPGQWVTVNEAPI